MGGSKYQRIQTASVELAVHGEISTIYILAILKAILYVLTSTIV